MQIISRWSEKSVWVLSFSEATQRKTGHNDAVSSSFHRRKPDRNQGQSVVPAGWDVLGLEAQAVFAGLIDSHSAHFGNDVRPVRIGRVVLFAIVGHNTRDLLRAQLKRHVLPAVPASAVLLLRGNQLDIERAGSI